MMLVSLALAELPRPAVDKLALGPECSIDVDHTARAPVVALSGRWAAVSQGRDLLLVDLRRCVPVAAGTAPRAGDDSSTRELSFEGDELLQRFDAGVVRWTIPELVPSPLRGIGYRDLVDLGTAPGGLGYARLVRGDEPSEYLDLPRVTVATTEEVVGTDEAGWGYWRGMERLAGGEDPLLAGIAGLYRAAGRLYATDGARDLDVLAGKLVPRPSGRPAVVPPGSGARFALVDVPGGTVVVGEGKQWGVVIPTRAEVGLASGDGRVAWIGDREGLGAWSVATGDLLWRVPMTVGDWEGAGLALGQYFAALGTAEMWMLFDPVDGDAAGSAGRDQLVAHPAYELGGKLDWTDFAGAWTAEAPTGAAWSPPPVSSLAGELSTYPATVPVVPGMERAQANADGTWTWQGPTRVKEHYATERGVVVLTEGELLLLARDGTAQWRRPPVADIRVAGDWVATESTATVALLDLATGREKWTVPAAELLALYADGVVVRRVPGAPPQGLRLRDGKVGRLPRDYPTRALGWLCRREGCTRESSPPAAARDFRKVGDRWVEYIDGGAADSLPTGSLRTVKNGAYVSRGAMLHGLAEPAPPGEVAPPVELPRPATAPRAEPRWIVERDRTWRVLDPLSRNVLATGDSQLLATSVGPGPLRYAVARADGASSIRDPAGSELLRVPGEVQSLHVGDDGQLAWTERSGERRVTCVSAGWCLPLDNRGDQLLGWEGDALQFWLSGTLYRVEARSGRVLGG